MMSVAALVIFYLGLWSFGLAGAWMIFREHRFPHAIILAPFLGTGLYVLATNAIGYLLPIRTAFAVAFFIFAAIGIIFLIKMKTRLPWRMAEDFVRKERALAVIAALIMVLTGVMAIHSLAYDDMFLGMLPLAKTIEMGNFPVMNPFAPDYPMPYHYGPPLLAAATTALTRVPDYLALDAVTTWAAPLLFLLLFFFIQDLTGNRKMAWGGALVGFLGGSFSWLNGFTCARSLFDILIRHQSVDGPFACAYYMLHGPVATPLFGFLHQHGTPLAAGLVFIVIWQFQKHHDMRPNIFHQIIIAITYAVFFAAIALFHESFLLTLIAGLIGSSVIFKSNRNGLLAILIGSALGLIAAFLQGGLLGAREGIGLMMKLNFDPTKIISWIGRVSVMRWNIITELLALVVFLIVATRFIYTRKQLARASPLILCALAAFAVPILFVPTPVTSALVIPYHSELFDTARFWSFGMWYLLPLVGAALAVYIGQGNRLKRFVGIAAGVCIVLTSLLWPLIYIPFYPIAGSGIDPKRPFVAIPAPLSKETDGAVAWINKNTPPQARVLVVGQASGVWVYWTGRFFPGVSWFSQFYPKHTEMHERLQRGCDEEALRFLKIDFAVATENPPWEDACLKQGVMRPVAQNQNLSWRIYEVVLPRS